MELNGTAVVITGGASGLGAATAELLARHGARIALLDRDAQAVADAAERIGATGYAVDVTDEESVSAALDDHESRWGAARVLVNCAGVKSIFDIVDDDGVPYPLDEYRRVIDINLVGTFNCLRLFAARLARSDVDEADRGLVINTSSVAGLDGADKRAAYVSSKAGVAGLTLSAARNLARYRIRVMSIAPGSFETPLLADVIKEHRARIGQGIPHPARLGQPEEFAQLVKAIIDLPYLNGEVIRIDGAMRI